MVDQVIPFLVNTDEIQPARGQATVLNELAMALIDCTNIYGGKIKKFGKLTKIATAFWPVRLIPLTDTRTCVCSYLLNKQVKLNAGKFSQIPPRPENLIKGADPESFLISLQDYNTKYLKRSKNFKRGVVIQEALFSANEIIFFQNFLLNQYNLNAHNSPYFILEGSTISKSINQLKIVQDVLDFVSQKDIGLLDKIGDTITKLCEKWVQKGGKNVEKIRNTDVDTSEEEKQLAILNKELQEEKERTYDKTPEELVKSGKYKINDKTDDLHHNINEIKNSVNSLKNAVNQRDLFLVEEGLKDLELKYRDLGNTISRYRNEINQLKRNIDREISDVDRSRKQKVRDLERSKSDVERDIKSKHSGLSKDLSDAEDIIAKITTEKQSALKTIESIKDKEMTDVQTFFNAYSLELPSKNLIVGIPIYIFYFVDPNTNRTTERAPILPILIEKGKIVSTKVKDQFRQKLRDLMNKDNAMISLVESEGEKNNLMEMKNIDNRLEDSINDLRVRKILNKKQGETAKTMIASLFW